MVRLRPLQESDAAEIGRWPQYQGDMAQMDYALRENGWLEECRSRPDTFVYAAEDGDDLVGFTMLATTGAAEAEFRIALRFDKTGLGLGEGVTRQTLRVGFQDLGFSRIHLIVRKNNLRGIRLHARLGFVARGECRKVVGGVPVDFWMMDIGGKEYLKGGNIQQSPRRALLVIDVQNDYVGGNLPIQYPPVELSLSNIGRAMDAARAAAVPVVVVQNVLPEGAPIMAEGTHGAELHASVASREWDCHVLKALPSAFANTDLEKWLGERQLDAITVVGYMTHNCVFSTVVQGLHRGFSVEFLSDAAGSLPYQNSAGSATAEEMHRVFAVVMQSRFAAVLTADEWIENLATGALPKRDNIYGSNQLAMSSQKTAKAS